MPKPLMCSIPVLITMCTPWRCSRTAGFSWGSYFLNLGGETCNYLGRLTPDGTLDPTFSPGADYDVSCFAVQDDGKLLVGGEFSTLAGQDRLSLARFNPDGSLDAAFNPEVAGDVLCLAVQGDGRILVGATLRRLPASPATTSDGSTRTGPWIPPSMPAPPSPLIPPCYVWHFSPMAKSWSEVASPRWVDRPAPT